MGRQIRFPGRAEIRMQRDDWGVLHIKAGDLVEVYRGLGYAHGLDRGLQLLMMRILGRGEGSQHLVADEAMLAIDVFFRRMNWAGQVESELAKLEPRTRELAAAYCDGLNTRLRSHLPWELKLLGYKPEPWTLADCVLLSRMTGYLSLSQSQAEVENLLLQMVQQGIDKPRLEALFGPLPDLDEHLLRQVRHSEFVVPEQVRWTSALPKLVASNNWVVAGSRTKSGRAMLANDPHLEGNRLPNVWYEIVLETPERYMVAATMPGLPGALLGRSRKLAWGATYTFMDAVDSWVEDVRGGRYRRLGEDGQERWQDFSLRRETIQRKGMPEHLVSFYENEHGVLSETPDEDGYYLATRWASAGSGGESLNRIAAMWEADSVSAGMDLLGGLETSWNWVLADAEGHIGYQMSGLMPRRRQGLSGLVPVPGWLPENDWQGFVPPDQLPRAYDPEAGYFVTANQDLNRWGEARPINMPMGAYRADRIAQRIEAQDKHDLRSFQAMQLDRYSLQAEAYLPLLAPLLEELGAEPALAANARLLAGWDAHYEPESLGATLFERFYRELLLEVFGPACGNEVCRALLDETGIVADFYANFDKILLSPGSPWFGGVARETLYRYALRRALTGAPQAWGQRNHFVLKHLLFGGKLPPAAGFDRGPVPVAGGRATPQQGQVYRSGNRDTSFVPSIRLITDFAAAGVHSCLLGGPSDRPFSRWYSSELANWQNGVYKYLSP